MQCDTTAWYLLLCFSIGKYHFAITHLGLGIFSMNAMGLIFILRRFARWYGRKIAEIAVGHKITGPYL